MTERLIAKLDRLGAEAGIKEMTPEIYRFAQLLNDDKLKQWDEWRANREWVGLTDKMLEFIDKQDHMYNEEWWCTPRTLYAGIMKEFGIHVGIDLAVPHQDRAPPPDVDRNAMLKELLPEIEKMFNLEYKERK